MLQRNRALLDRTAAALLATETMSEPEIARLKEEIVAPPALPAPGIGVARTAPPEPAMTPQPQTL